MTFDAYGDQATAGTRSYGYDALGRLTADIPAAGGGGYQFSYVGKTGTVASDGVSGYAWDPSGSVLAGTGAPGGGTGGVLALTDAHGDVLGQFTAAGTGVAGSQAYDPCGTVTATRGSMAGLLGFQSAWTDPASGKDLMGARWYNPAAGDFTSADTIQVSPVPDPAAGNPFAYGAGNPLGNVDPAGHYIIPVGNFAPPAPAPEAVSSPSCIANIGACLQAEGLVTSRGKIAPPSASVALNNAERTAEASAAKASAAKAAAAAKAKKLAEQKEQEQKAAAAKKAEDALKPADSSCVGPMIKLGACYSERFLAGNTPAQEKQSAIGAVLVLTSAIPVSDILDLLGSGSAAEDAGVGALRFTQTTASATFRNGTFAGRTIGDVVDALRSGAVKPSELPIDLISRGGKQLIMNTRSSLALLRAGVSVADWVTNDMTGDPFLEQVLTERLAKNGLTDVGTEVLRITGAGQWLSWLG